METPTEPNFNLPGSQHAETRSTQETAPLLIVAFQGHEKTYRSWRGGRSISGIRVTELEGITEEFDVNKTDTSGTLTLPAPEIGNLGQFVHEHISHPKGNERYNCHYFGYSIAGWPGAKPPRTRAEGLARVIITGRLNMAYDPGQLQEVADPSALEPGRIYGIGTPSEKTGKSVAIFHTLVGLNGPSLSVFGVGKSPDLVIADGAELAKFYGGEMYEITSPSTVPSSGYNPS
jgi:hypothetical protein